MSRRDLATLLILASLWGGSFVFIRIGAPALGPLPLAAGRVLLGGFVLWLALRLRGQRPRIRPHIRKLLILGLLNAALPYALIAAAELELTASVAALLNATIPPIAALLGVALLDERLTTRRTIGLVTGLGGVACIVGWTPFPMTWRAAVAIVAMLVACVSYAGATIYAKKALSDVPATALALGQQVGAAPWLLIPAAWALPRTHVTAMAALSLAGLGVLSTAVAYVLYFRLVANVGPTRTATVAYLFPVFGAIWGTLLLREPLSWGMGAGFVFILASMVLMNDVLTTKRSGRAGRAATPALPTRPTATAS